MKRLYFLTRNIESADSISQDMHDAGITDWNFHVLSKHSSGLYKRHLHSANMLQKTDIVQGIEKGLLRGLAFGVAIALVLTVIPIHGETLQVSSLISIILGAIILGGWHGSLYGYQNENHRLKPFHDRIEQGYFLVMIDVSNKQAEQVEELMRKKHPEAKYCCQDPTIVTPFEEPKELRF